MAVEERNEAAREREERKMPAGDQAGFRARQRAF
jgi:hypothetical protein